MQNPTNPTTAPLDGPSLQGILKHGSRRLQGDTEEEALRCLGTPKDPCTPHGAPSPLATDPWHPHQPSEPGRRTGQIKHLWDSAGEVAASPKRKIPKEANGTAKPLCLTRLLSSSLGELGSAEGSCREDRAATVAQR